MKNSSHRALNSLWRWTTFEPVSGLRLHIAATDRGIAALELASDDISFQGRLAARFLGATCIRDDNHPLLAQARRQLEEYFAGQRENFTLPLDLGGTPFQERVWAALLGIPYGHRISYAELARRIGAPRAFRAVGAANGKNPVAIVVPCHRVIASDGSLGGYSCGLAYKERLLELETRRKSSASSSTS